MRKFLDHRITKEDDSRRQMLEFNWPRHRFDSEEHSFYDQRPGGFRKRLTSSRLAFRIADQARLRSSRTGNLVSSAIRLINWGSGKGDRYRYNRSSRISTSAIVLDGLLFQGKEASRIFRPIPILFDRD